MAAFLLTRAIPEDIPKMIGIIGGLSDEDVTIRDFAMGPNTAEQREINARTFQATMTQDPQQFWLKVTEQSSGRIVSGSMWQIHPTVVPEVTRDTRPRPWLDEDTNVQQRVKQTLKERFVVEKCLRTQPHIRLGLTFTDPNYRRRGAGGMMMQWGCDLADHLFLPIWVEATPKGKLLYERFGFEIIHGGLPIGDFLKREPRF
ncbi:hypothetical protein K461DRAFT_283055 [Myriangium duriaei CBS 260.36]|uniref:N-acetyltransferase domain-containing protein n=1 Tax=Myriangium duriaei CBS 260.36 TaxID=1168546 RepID=A0A9P4MCJ6_9PEZI|nr:hypothetical protein K461DRAFT_283055 [Myriangium duriaei CBS 260.36]